MAKTLSLGIRLQPEVKAALERAALADGRSLSNLVERVLSLWLTEHGHMQAPPAPKAAGKKKGAPVQ
jgi:ribbon-helix-helix CopG family protein